MKPLLMLILATGLGAACSRSEPRPAADAEQPAVSAPARPADAPPTGAAASPSAPAPGSVAASAPAAPAVPPAPTFREITIPAGTELRVTVLNRLASNTSKVEDPVKGALAKPVVISDRTVVPANSEIRGFVTEAKESGRVKGKASIAFRFDHVVVHGETHQIQTAPVIREAQQKKSDDVKKGGVGAAVGAVVGGVAGGGSGAAIGAVAGGAGTVLVTKGGEVEVPAGTVVTVLVQEPLTVRVPDK